MGNVREILSEVGDNRQDLLLILHRIQDRNPQRCLCEADLRELAESIGMPFSELYSTASFYTMFSFKPRGRHIIRVCESPPCHVMGAETIFNCLEELLGVGVGETTPDGVFTLEATSCLGICGVAPAMMINDESYGNLTPGKIAGIISDIRARGNEK